MIAAPLCPVTAAQGPSWRAVGAQLRGHQRRGTAADREIIYINHHFILSRLKAIKAYLDGILQQTVISACYRDNLNLQTEIVRNIVMDKKDSYEEEVAESSGYVSSLGKWKH